MSRPLLHDPNSLSPCNHEETDSRMMLHANHAALHGHLKILIRRVDTDVVILAVSVAETLGPQYEFWLAFGIGKHFQHLAAHKIAIGLGPKKARHFQGSMPSPFVTLCPALLGMVRPHKPLGMHCHNSLMQC